MDFAIQSVVYNPLTTMSNKKTFVFQVKVCINVSSAQYADSDVINRFKSSTTHWCAIRWEEVNVFVLL